MLAGLARWLRAAGHDTALAPGSATDRVILEACQAQARVLLTRDRHLAAHAGGGMPVLLLVANDIDAQAAELVMTLDLDWTLAPFSRCLLDNTPLREATPEERDRIPARSRELPGPLRTCPGCGRIYWPGSHVRRMRARLERWHGFERDIRRANPADPAGA